MNVAQLRVVLEHLPDDLDVWIHGHGIVNEVRRPYGHPGQTAGLHLDCSNKHDGLVLRGVFADRRTLDVRLEGLAS